MTPLTIEPDHTEFPLLNVEAFKTAQEPLTNLLRTHLESAYANDTAIPRVVVLAYLAGYDKNMELLNV